MKIKKFLFTGFMTFFLVCCGSYFLPASSNGNLVINGDFETGDGSGWVWDKGTKGTGTWIAVVETDVTGNHYLKMAKDWWGYNRFYQEIDVTTIGLDLDISASLRPVLLGQAGTFPIQEGVTFTVDLHDAADLRVGRVQYYFATYHDYPTTGAIIYIKLGDSQLDDYVHISYNLQDTILSHVPGFDFSNVVKIRVWLKNFQASHAREWAIGYFDNISVKKSMIPADVVVHPNSLSTKSKGKWITAYIELPEGSDVNDIDVSSVTLDFLNGTVSAESRPSGVGDFDDDGILDLMVKFRRSEVISLLSGTGGFVSLSVSGELLGCGGFAGEDFIWIK